MIPTRIQTTTSATPSPLLHSSSSSPSIHATPVSYRAVVGASSPLPSSSPTSYGTGVLVHSYSMQPRPKPKPKPKPQQQQTTSANARSRSWDKEKDKLNNATADSEEAARNNAASEEDALYNIYERPVSEALQLAYDCIHGLPFRGSLAFVARLGSLEASCYTRLAARFQGPAELRATFAHQHIELNLRVLSAGHDDGNNARLVVNGVDFCLNRRGWNLALVEPTTMNVEVAAFDTHTASRFENERLQEFVGRASRRSGCLLLAAVKDDASAGLASASMSALRSVGMLLPEPDNAALMCTRLHELPPSATTQLLNVCAVANAVRCMEALVRRGWDLNAHSRHEQHNTPLHDATRTSSHDVLRLLLRLNAERRERNSEGLTADDMARALHHFDSIEAMLAPRKSHQMHVVESLLRELEI